MMFLPSALPFLRSNIGIAPVSLLIKSDMPDAPLFFVSHHFVTSTHPCHLIYTRAPHFSCSRPWSYSERFSSKVRALSWCLEAFVHICKPSSRCDVIRPPPLPLVPPPLPLSVLPHSPVGEKRQADVLEPAGRALVDGLRCNE